LREWSGKVFEIRGLSEALILVLLGGSVLASSFLIPLHSFLPAWTHFDDSYNIDPEGRTSLRIGLMSGSTVRVMVIIGDGDRHIGFSIEDYDGKTIISENLESAENLFEFQPSRTDFHVLVFENNGSTPQSLRWIVLVYYYDTLFQLLGVTLPILGVVMIALGWSREKQVFAEPIVKPKLTKKRRARDVNLGMDISLVKGIGPKWSEEMRALGIDSVHELTECSPEDLAQKVGVSEKTASAWIENASEILSLLTEATLSEG